MTLCNLNIEMGGRSGFVAPDDATFQWIAGPALCAAGRACGTARWRIGARSRPTTTRNSTASVTLDCDGARAADHLGHRSEPGARHLRPRARSVRRADRGRRAAIEGALAYMGLTPGMPLAGLPVEPRVHRLLHQRAAARPAGRRRRSCAAASVAAGRHRHGGAGLLDGEARGRGRGPRPGVPRRRLLLGRIRLLDVRRRQRRPRRAGRAHRLHHQPQLREPPGPEGAHASRQPGDGGGDRDRRPHRRRAADSGRA